MMMDLTPDPGEKMVCDERLWAFIQGDVDTAEALLVATHCCLCPEAAKRLKQLLSCAASVMESNDSQKMHCSGQEFFERNCSDVKAEAEKITVTTPVPKPLQVICGLDFDALDWQENDRGFHELELSVPDSQMSVGLYKMPQGFRVPEHTHIKDELGLVLLGEIYEEGQTYRAGDISVREAGGKNDRHSPEALTDTICMIVYG